MGDYLNRPSEPFNEFEPIDSSAAAIAAQGLLRLGHYLRDDDPIAAKRYWQAGLTTAKTLLQEPYLSTSDQHEGLLLHTVYHRPRNWDYVPEGSKIPHSESCMWGDYHLRQLGLYIQRFEATDRLYYTFF